MLKNNKKGVSLVIAIVILSVLLAAALGLGTIILFQARVIKEAGDSVVAFCAADSGVEDALYRIYVQNENLPFNVSSCFPENTRICYQINAYSGSDTHCPPNTHIFCLNSIGSFLSIRRAIQTRY